MFLKLPLTGVSSFVFGKTWFCWLWSLLWGQVSLEVMGIFCRIGTRLDLVTRKGESFMSHSLTCFAPYSSRHEDLNQLGNSREAWGRRHQSVLMSVSLILERDTASPPSPSVLVWGKHPFKEWVFSILSITASKSGWVIKCQLTVNNKLLGSRSET